VSFSSMSSRNGAADAGTGTASSLPAGGADSSAGPALSAGQGPRAGQAVAAWPLSSYLELRALPTAVPCARLHARQVLWEWGLDALAETAELMVSEIVTNAVRASAGLTTGQYPGQRLAGMTPVRLWLTSDRSCVMIQVWDADHRMPIRQEAGPEAENGRGLLLVDCLSADWGSYMPERSSGKVVWARVGEAKP
jgi:hypothetical protein